MKMGTTHSLARKVKDSLSPSWKCGQSNCLQSSTGINISKGCSHSRMNTSRRINYMRKNRGRGKKKRKRRRKRGIIVRAEINERY
jgi:hypothetical protein